MTKEQLLKLYDLKLITLVTSAEALDSLLEKVQDMDESDALTYLKNQKLLTHVVNNDSLLTLLSDDVNAVAEVNEDDVVNPTTEEDEDDVVKPTTEEDEDDSPIVDDGDDEE